MKITEIITETAHHSRMITTTIGIYTVHIDSHAFVTISHRGLSLGDVTNILTFAFKYVPEINNIPRGKGAYFQDTNTLISLYIRRSQHYPNEFTLETVLSPDMKPTPPLFRRSVPDHDMIDSPDLKASMAAMRQVTTARGRDAVSQDIEDARVGDQAQLMQRGYKPKSDWSEWDSVQPMNRKERRALSKLVRRQKDE